MPAGACPGARARSLAGNRPPGPAGRVAAREALFQELGYRDASSTACFVLETDRPPPDELIGQVAESCGLPEQALTFVLTPTTSLAGTVQIVARVLEVALHKAHALDFPLADIVDGLGTAPLPPPAPDFLAAMGRTNDAVLFGGEVQLFVARRREARARTSPSVCRAPARATTASPSPSCSRRRASTSTSSTRCCSAPPG